jgi:RHS repeat-associated protein
MARTLRGHIRRTARISCRSSLPGKERDWETGLDFFGARYFSSAQGRFTSADPVIFQAEMLTDPQRFNLYAYTRNNPLRFVDPTGERIELTGATEEERKKQLADIQYGVGGGAAGDRLTINEENGHYYVDAGNLDSFGKISRTASEWTGLLSKDTENVMYGYAASADELPTRQGADPSKSFHMAGNGQGVTYRDTDGNLRVYVLRPKESITNESGLDFVYPTFGSFLSGMLFGPETNRGTVAAHELGHARYRMMIGPGNDGYSGTTSNQSAVELENMARKAHDPNAPMRVNH